MRPQRYHIRFPSANLTSASQSEAHFLIAEDRRERRIDFHDHAEIYNHPGLYEQLFYQRLKCTSPAGLSELLRSTDGNAGVDPSQLRVLDVGAGNGMVGELLVAHGSARVVGIDTSRKPSAPRIAIGLARTTRTTSPTAPSCRRRCWAN